MNKLTNGKTRLNAKPIAAYLLTVIIAAGFTLLYDRRFGVPFLTALLAAPVFSCLPILLSASRLSAGLSLSKDSVCKGETVGVSLALASAGLLPLPFVLVELCGGFRLTSLSDGACILSVSKKEPAVVKQSFQAEIWGHVPLGVRRIAVHDYLGLFQIEYEGPSERVSIYPTIHESQKNDLLGFVCNEMAMDDKDGEQSEVRSFLTQPGYEHRPYMPGDSLKRVNWKLLAKYDRYMVRENEFIKSKQPVLVLDPQGLSGKADFSERRRAACLEERIVEAVLAMLVSMVKEGLSCTVLYYVNDGWRRHEISRQDEITALQNTFAHYQFTERGKLTIPDGLLADDALVMLFTCALDQMIEDRLPFFKTSTNLLMVSTANYTKKYDRLWIVNEAYDFYAL